VIEVKATLTMYDGESLGDKRWYTRTFRWPAVPRAGDRIEITNGGWTEEVRDVWFLYDGSIAIEFAMHVTDSATETIKRSGNLHYVADEDLAALEPAGWERHP
jgi:hypothetical protein